jgi:hypothetical protein
MTPKHLLIFIGLIFLINCASQTPYISKTKDIDIQIDGNPEEWTGSLQYFDDAGLGYSIRHDQENIYLVAVTNDRQMIRQIRARGLLIWFDVTGKTNKEVGIKYPVGLLPQYLHRDQGTGRDFSNPPKIQTDFEFYLKGKKKQLLPLYNNDLNIRIEPIKNRGIFAVEIAIPVRVIYEKKSLPPSGKLGIGFELAELDQEAIRSSKRDGMNQRPEGMGPGRGGGVGTGGRSAGMRGRSGGRMPMQRDNRLIEFNKWLKVEFSD